MVWHASSAVDMYRNRQLTAVCKVVQLMQPFDNWCIPFTNGANLEKQHCALRTLGHHCWLASVQVSLDPAYVSKLNARDKGDRFPDDPSDLDAEPQSLAYSFQDE